LKAEDTAAKAIETKEEGDKYKYSKAIYIYIIRNYGKPDSELSILNNTTKKELIKKKKKTQIPHADPKDLDEYVASIETTALLGMPSRVILKLNILKYLIIYNYIKTQMREKDSSKSLRGWMRRRKKNPQPVICHYMPCLLQ
jgi:hypothetical protein